MQRNLEQIPQQIKMNSSLSESRIYWHSIHR